MARTKTHYLEIVLASTIVLRAETVLASKAVLRAETVDKVDADDSVAVESMPEDGDDGGEVTAVDGRLASAQQAVRSSDGDALCDGDGAAQRGLNRCLRLCAQKHKDTNMDGHKRSRRLAMQT